MKLEQYISISEVKSYIAPSNLRGAVAVVFDWVLIAGAMFLCAIWPNPLAVVVALIVIGGRQLGLGVLVHETTHHSLFKTRWLNDFVGRWVCGGPVWQDLPRYRRHHLKHHQFSGSLQDPDLSLVSPFPVSKASMRRKLLRDLFGLTGLKRVVALFQMDLGLMTYTMAADPKPLDQKGRTRRHLFRDAVTNMAPMVITNSVLFICLFLAGKPWLYLLWVGSYLTTFSLFLRVRSIAEHACTTMDQDPLKNTRTTIAGLLARLTVAPHRVNYHLEHHLWMTVPYFNLPRVHALLCSRGAYQNAYIANGYFEVLNAGTKQFRE